MPSVSKSQRKLAAIALHHPELLREENKSMKKMPKDKLREFASTKEKNLPERKKKTRKKASRGMTRSMRY